MGKLLKKAKKWTGYRIILRPAANQDGSIILIALMLLVIMTVIALVSADSVVTENFIIRNEAVYQQNVNMAEAAMMEGLQRFMQIPPDNPDIVYIGTSTLAWVKDIHSDMATTNWYAVDSSTRVLDSTNSMAVSTPKDLTDRGENAFGNLRYAFVGWDIVALPGGGSESLGIAANKPVWRSGRILTEYVSLDGSGADHGNGIVRMEIGVKRRIVMN